VRSAAGPATSAPRRQSWPRATTRSSAFAAVGRSLTHSQAAQRGPLDGSPIERELDLESLRHERQVGQAGGVSRRTRKTCCRAEMLVRLVDTAARESLRVQPALEAELSLAAGALNLKMTILFAERIFILSSVVCGRVCFLRRASRPSTRRL